MSREVRVGHFRPIRPLLQPRWPVQLVFPMIQALAWEGAEDLNEAATSQSVDRASVRPRYLRP
jgi:hypothetical protein